MEGVLVTPPTLSALEAGEIAETRFGVSGRLEPLPSWADQNFRIDASDGQSFVLKIANPSESRVFLEAQNEALRWIATRDPSLLVPRPISTRSGEFLARVTTKAGVEHHVRLLKYLTGELMSNAQRSPVLLRSLGELLARVDAALEGFKHPGARRVHLWDLANAPDVIQQFLSCIDSAADRALVRRLAARYGGLVSSVPLRRSVIHADGNDCNVLVGSVDGEAAAVGLIDFGDMVESSVVFEVAVAATYATLGSNDPLEAIADVASGYHVERPLEDHEIEILHGLVVLRLCVSVVLSAMRKRDRPDDPYLTISEDAAWRVLRAMESLSPARTEAVVRASCDLPRVSAGADLPGGEALRLRRRHLGPNLSLAYGTPLRIVRGSMQYLYDDADREFLDCVNNVCHVGHCHPRVVDALSGQAKLLNTNTRYLHDGLVTYAARLVSMLPDPLSVCYLVCTGSEANDLALRLAAAHTGSNDVVVVDGAYHGNTRSLIDISPYKHDGPGGNGAPAHVHKVLMPDRFRGPHRDARTAGDLYAREVAKVVEELTQRSGGIASFFCESLLSCGGQIELPDEFLARAYAAVRHRGGVCVADEVQVGFGRVGTHFWGFETQGVIPDIVTMGKPIGNGHPLAAVVTTPRIAASFDNGMEYFNTFGGNPVSCAVGHAVLDVIQDEGLQEHALRVGERLRLGLEELEGQHEAIGDVRGRGLFLGVEFVEERNSRAPSASLARLVVENLKGRGILVSTDGPAHNVIKIKPPMVFTETNADDLVAALDEVLSETRGRSGERAT